MRLKKLKIVGFKSFADSISLNFDAEVIGVVGPNGCGKSNIVDAFRWVMGEQSAKSLRGEKMQDVLFAGTEKRKALNVAEVSVTLTDVKGALSIDYEEITITRRLHRSGESEYLINGELSRLKDLQNLFMGTGIGKNAFSVFEQGKLDQVIHLTPLERRGIFDESAGIGRFLQQKKESLRKLEQVSENHARVKDIHTEVDKQTRQLKKQAALARSYQDNKNRLESLEKAALIFRWEAASSTSREYGERYEIAKEDLKKAQAVLQANERRVESLKKQLAEKENTAKAFQEKVYHAESGAKIKKVEGDRLRSAILELEEREKKLLKELHDMELKKEKEGLEVKQKEEKATLLFKEKETLEKDVKEKFRVFHSLELEVTALRDELKALQKKHLELSQEEHQLAKQLQEKTLRLEAAQERLEKVQLQALKRQETLQLHADQVEERRKKVASLLQAIEERRHAIDALGKEILLLKEDISKGQKQLTKLQQEAAETQARLKALQRLRDEGEGFSGGAKQILKEAKNAKSPLYKKVEGLFEHIIPKKGHEKIVAVALKPYMQTLVVQTRGDLELLVQEAQEKKWKDFSVVCLDLVQGRPNKKKRLSKEHEWAENSLLSDHFLSPLSLSEDISSLLNQLYEEGRLVFSQEGYFIDHQQVLSQFPLGQEENNAFLREAEIKSLEEQTTALQEQKVQDQKALDKLLLDKNHLEEKQKVLDEERRKFEISLVQENFALQQILSDIELGKKERVAFEEEERKLLASSEDYAVLIEGLKLELKRAQDKCHEIHARILENEKKLEERLGHLKNAKESHQKQEISFRQLVAEWHRVNHEIKIFEARDQEGQQHQKKQLSEVHFTKEKAKEARSRLLSSEAESKALGLESEELRSTYEGMIQEVGKWKEEQSDAEKAISLHRESLSQIEASKHRFEILMAEDTSSRKSIEKELQERFHLSIEEAKKQSIPLESSLEEAEKAIRKLRVELEKAGAVNMASIEECKEQEERFLFLDKQLKDLEEAKQDLEALIGKLESESRKLFKNTFEAIRKNFQKNFQILFNGGEADLKFTESPDVLEAGIEIIAKPPGKQMRSISLLSGGEKCMTALALLFSIFEVKPAPFCILDEVDAPLDDTNIERFTNVLKQFIQNTQFIIVTHNKKTMAIADILFGVSMEEKGVSKLISLTFERKKQEVLQ